MNVWNELDQSILDSYHDNWKADEKGHLVRKALADHSLMSVALDRDLANEMPFTFSIDLDPDLDGLTDQGTSSRCWCFAALNVCRFNVKNKLKLAEKDFQLSQCFTYFYDQLEKSNQFLDRVIRLIDKPLEDRMVRSVLSDPISDFGYLSFWDLAEKYGTVPKSVMPDVYVLADTRPVTRTLSMKLRWCARELRSMRAGGADDEALQKAKIGMVGDIYGMLCRFLGEPPRRFTWEYRDANGGFHRVSDITPVEYFREYCGVRRDDLVFICHEPLMEVGRVYYRAEFPGDPFPEGGRTNMNLDIDTIKDLAVKSLEEGLMVTFGSDVGKFSSKDDGYAAPELYDLENLFGTKLMMDVPDSLAYKWTIGTHIMCFDGVNLDENGKPDRWKVQNSYGVDMGIKGHYIASDAWVSQFLDEITVYKSVCSPEILQMLKGDPIPM